MPEIIKSPDNQKSNISPEIAGGDFYEQATESRRPFLTDDARRLQADNVAKLAKAETSNPGEHHQEIPGVDLPHSIPDHKLAVTLEQIINNPKNVTTPGGANELQSRLVEELYAAGPEDVDEDL